MFAGLWPGFDEDEVPIASVTNGVHAPTWVSPRDPRARRARDRPGVPDEGTGWDAFDKVDDSELWRVRGDLRERLVGEIRRRIKESGLQRGMSEAELGWIDDVFDPDVLTIGFARRVPSYKRLTLMLRDPERLRALLLDPERPMQIVIAGKSHPADDGGKQLIQQMVQFADDPAVRHRIVVPARLRHRHGPLPVLGRRRLAEQPAAPAGGLRHVGHEGGAQRRAQPVDPRRLVGRVVRRRERLGDPVRRRRRRPGPARRPRGGTRCTT